MKNKLKIFYVAAEVFPFIQTGGAAQVAGALPKYLKNLGHDIRVMMPNYRQINERKYVLRDVIRLQDFEVQLGENSYNASAKSAFIPDSKVQIYFLDNKFFFDRAGINRDNQRGKEFEDNAERYLFFSLGCLETLKLLYWQPDIIHCNDWQTALIPILLKSVYANDDFFKNTRTLLSVHDFAKQGIFSFSGERAGIPETFLNSNNNKSINFLQTGLIHADSLNTVSQAYALEIKEKKGTDIDFADILKKRNDELVGIVNGIDDALWNPEKDRHIQFKFSQSDLSGKSKNKEQLLDHFGLKFDEKKPLFGFLSPLVEGKGIDILTAIIDQIMKLNLQLIICGQGDPKFHKKLEAFKKKFPDTFGFEFDLNADFEHLFAAGCDISLMPLCLEPCALHHLYGFAYGTIPIVSDASGMADTVCDFNIDSKSGTGFVFHKFDSKELLKTIKRAIEVFQDSGKWSKVVQNAMKQNFSWSSSAPQYVKLYQKLVSIKNNKKRDV